MAPKSAVTSPVQKSPPISLAAPSADQLELRLLGLSVQSAQQQAAACAQASSSSNNGSDQQQPLINALTSSAVDLAERSTTVSAQEVQQGQLGQPSHPVQLGQPAQPMEAPLSPALSAGTPGPAFALAPPPRRRLASEGGQALSSPTSSSAAPMAAPSAAEPGKCSSSLPLPVPSRHSVGELV